MKVTTHGAQDKGTRSRKPSAPADGNGAVPPGGQVSSSNCARYAFPSTGKRRMDYGKGKY